MTTFTRYYDYYLEQWVEASDQQEIVEEIKGMVRKGVDEIREYLISELHTPGYSNRPVYEQRCNILFLTAVAKRQIMLNETPQKAAPMSWAKTCLAAITGVVIGEIASTAFINHRNVLNEEATLRQLQIRDLTK